MPTSTTAWNTYEQTSKNSSSSYGYAGIGPWPYWWGPTFYYMTYYPYMHALRLPTRSILRKGLPEGVIAPGGYVQGFLFFSNVNPNLTQVAFIARLQGAHTTVRD
jgi:hypothetical protein